jgi:hypothetical protein
MTVAGLFRLRRALAVAAVAFAALPAHAQSVAPAPEPDCTTYPCGRVLSIAQTTVTTGWTRLGTTVNDGSPGSQGNVVQYRIGPGFTNQGAVLLGSAGGAQYGKTPNSYQAPRWNVAVKLDSGQVRTVSLAFEPFVREGDRVRVVGSNVELVE